MPATIFAGSKVKALKGTMSLNGGADIISSTTDPTSVAVDASPGSLLLNTTSGKLYRKNDSGSSTNWSEVGSGGSGINYVTNPTASTNTTGWSTYADAAGSAPVDGTGGSPTVTWTRSTTTPLRGSADFNFVKLAVNSQGEGVATDITIDLADQAKVLTVSFDYEVLSGTYATGDLTVYLIADPSGTPVVIQPAGYQIQAGTAGTKLKQIATFQTQATGQTYRVCFHVASTSASAYSLAVDNVVVGPQTVQYGAPVTDWQSYTPTYNGITSTGTGGSANGRWRRVGDTMHVFVSLEFGTGPSFTGGALLFDLPSGYSIDTSKVPSAGSITNAAFSGSGYVINDTGTVRYPVTPFIIGTRIGLNSSINAGSAVTSTSPFSFGVGDGITFVAQVPILGWSSTVQMSNDTDTRVVAAKYAMAGSVTASTTVPVDYATKVFDTHNAVTTGSAWKFTAPVSGIYRVSAMWASTGASNGLFLYKNGTLVSPGGYVNPTFSSTPTVGETLVSLNGGEYIDVRPNTSITGANDTQFNISIERLSGPSAIAATETVAGRWLNTAGTGVTTNIASYPAAVIPFASVDSSAFDTHGMASGSGTTWKVTAPISGKYVLTANMEVVAGAGALSFQFYKNGTTVVSWFRSYESGTNTTWVSGSSTVSLSAGDYIQILAATSVAQTLGTPVGQNVFTMTRVGN